VIEIQAPDQRIEIPGEAKPCEKPRDDNQQQGIKRETQVKQG
jgi:hypothetical protein